jgi:uncharacterized damage-inducible protein DinB
MMAENLVRQLNQSKEFFDRATYALDEDDSGYCPTDEMMTAAAQVAHVALTVDWFREGAARPEGFDMDFENHMKACMAVTSLTEARAMYDKAHAAATAFIGGMSDAELQAPLPEGPVMGGAPKFAIVGGIEDHTAHHRGALSVYSRLVGKVPPMPYMDVPEA